MADETEISWCDATFNPWSGCTKVSPACDICYAEVNYSVKMRGVKWGKYGNRIIASDSMWKQPLKWNRQAEAEGVRKRVFCASLADVFEGFDSMPESAWEAVREARTRLWATIALTPNLDWLLLTKRPENVLRYYTFFERDLPRNVWIGTTVENQKYADIRIPELLKIPAAVRFLSVEPMLGPVDLSSFLGGLNVTEEHRGNSVPSRARGEIGTTLGRHNMAGETLRQDADMQETAAYQQVFLREGDAGSETGEYPATEACLSAFQGSDTGGADSQSQRRSDDEQPSRQPRAGDLSGADSTFDERIGSRPKGSGRSQECDGEVGRSSSADNSATARGGRGSESDSGRLRDFGPNGFKDRQGRPLAINLVICGGESGGQKARPLHPDWVRGLRDQCVSAGVPFHFKQWGEWAPCEQYPEFPRNLPLLKNRRTIGVDGSTPGPCWEAPPPQAAGLFRVGKKHSGRTLDSREWLQFPEAK